MSQIKRFCDNCGKEITWQNKFCIHCGHKFPDESNDNANSTPIPKKSENAKSVISVLCVLAAAVSVLAVSALIKNNLDDLISEDDVSAYTYETLWNEDTDSVIYEDDSTTEQNKISSTTSAKKQTDSTLVAATTSKSTSTKVKTTLTSKTTITKTRSSTNAKASTTRTTTTTKKTTATTTKKKAPARYDVSSIAAEVKAYGISRGLIYGKGSRHMCCWGLSSYEVSRNQMLSASKWLLDEDHPDNNGATHFVVTYGECYPQIYDDYTDYYIQIDLYY